VLRHCTVFNPDRGLRSFCRCILFFSCRRFLIDTFYSNLEDLSSPSVKEDVPGSPSRNDIPLDGLSSAGLPLPAQSPSAKTTKHGRAGVKEALHTSISRSLFSLCFSESCMLFLLLMMQGLDVYSPRCVFRLSGVFIGAYGRVLHPSDRLLNWKLSLYTLITTILVFIPTSMTLLLTVWSDISLGKSLSALSTRHVFNFIDLRTLRLPTFR
jgi:hypothetical protein